MSDPSYTPHRFVLGLSRRPGEPLSEFGRPGPTRWTLPRGTTDTAHLRGAVVQHLFVVGLRRATARTGTPVEDFAAAAGRTRQEWTRVLAGQVLMRATDAAAIALAGPDALPDGREAFATVARVSSDADDELAARIAMAAGDPGPYDDRGVHKALGAPMVHAQRPLNPGAQQGLRDARKGLRSYLDAAVATLTTARGLPPEAGQDIEVDVDAAHHGEGATATGYAGPGSLISLAVHPDWADTVGRPGWGLLAGWLVLDIRLRDDAGRPTAVVVLDLVPDWNGSAREDDTAPAWGWAYRPSLASVTWDGSEPTVTIDAPP